VPDGNYTAVFHAEYPNGDSTEVNLGPLVVDRAAPKAEAKVESTIFSPNDDGINDTLPIQQTSVPGDDWRGTIVDMAGKEVRGWTWEGTVQSFEWDAGTTRAMSRPTANINISFNRKTRRAMRSATQARWSR
jgi:hypothetical protein